MPTFDDPVADASEAAEALRGLAHASRAFDDPAATYAVLGDLLGGVRSLRQVVAQLGAAHFTHRVRAYDDARDQTAGATFALATTRELQHAALLLDAVHDQLDAAMAHSGKIAWHPSTVAAAPVSRWVSVVFLQGQEADEVLKLLDREGTDAAIEHLAGYDFGEEATQAALVNGYVYDTIPTGALDHVSTSAEYTLTYNHDLGHVSLLRSYVTPAENEPSSSEPTLARSQARRSTPVVEAEDDAFAVSRSSSVMRGRSL